MMQVTLSIIGAISGATYITQAVVEIWANGLRGWVQISTRKIETDVERGVIEADHLI